MSSAAALWPLRRATYADVEAAPPNKVAELIRGALHVMPRPALRHARASTRLTGKLTNPFDLGEGGPGGWILLDEPELHFPDPTEPGAIDVLVPDLAGWRRDRVPELPDAAFTTIAPDWICEVLSPSTKDFDRDEKMPVYAREGVQWAWLIDPIAKTLEIYVLAADGRWGEPVIFRGADVVRAVPFDAIELGLSTLWM
jgi:Uma2 family endonuclease